MLLAPSCADNVSCAGCVSMSPPSPCRQLSCPPSTTGGSDCPWTFDRPSRVGWVYLLPGVHGLSQVLGTSLSACQALRTPVDPQASCHERCLCVGFRCVKTVAVCIDRLDEAVPDFRVCGHPSGLQSSLCTLHMVCSEFCSSSPRATLGTGGRLDLSWQGLAPCKKRQACLAH